MVNVIVVRTSQETIDSVTLIIPGSMLSPRDILEAALSAIRVDVVDFIVGLYITRIGASGSNSVVSIDVDDLLRGNSVLIAKISEPSIDCKKAK